MVHNDKTSVITKFPSPLKGHKLLSRIYLPPKIAGNLNQLKAWSLREQAVAFRCIRYVP